MATVKLNGQSLTSGTLCFSDSINILEYNDSITGTSASITLTFGSSLQSTVTADSQYYITILDETITNVMSTTNATNKRFYIGSTTDSTAAYVANALNACESLAADWLIYNDGSSVYLTARTIGQKLTNVSTPFSTNIPSGSTTFTYSTTDGTSTSNFGGKVYVQLTAGTVVRLEKSVYDERIGFNLSPILSTYAEFGKDKPFNFDIFALSNSGAFSSEVTLTNSCFCTYGYQANQSSPFIKLENRILLNNKRGNDTITLYTYSNKIPFTVISMASLPNISASTEWRAYNSANGFITSGTSTGSTTSGHMIDMVVTVPQTAFTSAYYIDLVYGNDTIRYNVIKPIKMAEGYTRIYWRNEYGGISFFDFTGSRSETDAVEVETYNKNFYHFYDNPLVFDEKAPYKNTATKEVKLKSHILDEKGKYVANSLIRSKRMWTYVNGNLQYVVPKSMEVEEDATYNGLYSITFTYEYSQLS